MNDVLKLLSDKYNTCLYADDMLLIYQMENLYNMIEGIQDKSNNIMTWCGQNILTINQEKTKFMLVR